ncbi:hypothetical protein BKA58DRAFT_117635 [Alternaria rosae]|uniref:uncharacterized protein n=1 Tax=Alternaria rosae TaxID=1187941 RepID=UPI001E8E0D7B|nr:uncharacterized protein BKA58DRAFT_117635 [Alternaria rosae]KAH6875220.1 hypothetical protein BKA58DRAFT_117635 [Alternaria rosae]
MSTRLRTSILQDQRNLRHWHLPPRRHLIKSRGIAASEEFLAKDTARKLVFLRLIHTVSGVAYTFLALVLRICAHCLDRTTLACVFRNTFQSSEASYLTRWTVARRLPMYGSVRFTCSSYYYAFHCHIASCHHSRGHRESPPQCCLGHSKHDVIAPQLSLVAWQLISKHHDIGT